MPPTPLQAPAQPNPVLAAWLALEVLAPHALPNAEDCAVIGRELVRLDQHPEPWQQPRFARRNGERAVYWMVYLGELDLAQAVASILQLYPDDAADERSAIGGNTALAVLVLDSQGRPVKDKTFLSSFAWGYGQVRDKRLDLLAGFPEAERRINERLTQRTIRQDQNGILPLTHADIVQAIDWLGNELNIPDGQIQRPGFAIRAPQRSQYPEAPEPEILNSFFIDDLVKARAALTANQVGKALSAYLDLAPRQTRQDVVCDPAIVAQTLAPNRFPLTRWPVPGRYPLALMQQAAINNAVTETMNGGLVAVNGPPGTGKTTLLRDMIAKVTLDRAIAMSAFDNPVKAFSHVGQMKTWGAYTHLYRLHDSLIGHEIVVASSNNKAVENISREIPSSGAIAQDLQPPARYFWSISDAIAAGNATIADAATWGLAAAVLGSSANRRAFFDSFYWHPRRGMARYLKAVLGMDLAADANGDGSNIGDVAEIEQPPHGEIEAMERWQLARGRFQARLKQAEAMRAKAQAGYDAVQQRLPANARVSAANGALIAAKQAHATCVAQEASIRQSYAQAQTAERNATDDRRSIESLRPGFFARLFGTRSYRQWRRKMAQAQELVERSRRQRKTVADLLQQSIRATATATIKIGECDSEKLKADTALARIDGVISSIRATIGPAFADERFWMQDDAALQLQSPWIFKCWQDARDALFVETFALHRAFIDAAAKPLRHNLRAAVYVINGRVLNEQQEQMRRSLWASFFMVVPVISTTFASTARLFGPLAREQLGWLLIDEAGQAVPQAAIGALWRAKRAIVIGDPLQIQPVVTTPPKLIRAVCSEYALNPEDWAAPDMSAQTLADRVSWFGTNIGINMSGDIWVGSPLRVHRRCEEPMFKISNHVAYNGLMVHGTTASPSPVGKILGESLWIDVTGEANGKWCAAEGRRALELLRKLINAGIADPDVFFITPFRIVAEQLRETIRNDSLAKQRLPGPLWKWTKDRVGTIHTFQGKEADAVVLVLGAPLDASAGARRWAGYPPNLLNVAVTRAKRRLYVIGHRSAWQNAGAFRHLAQSLPVLGKMPASDTQAAHPAIGADTQMAAVLAALQTLANKRTEPSVTRCRSCGSPAIPGDDVCYTCKPD